METLKSIFPTNGRQLSQINSVTKDGTSYTTPEEISNVFNEHFISIADNIIDKTINTEPDITSLVDFVRRNKAGNSLKWFESYLSGRYQKVCVYGKLSEQLSIQSSVPQGSILGPALFLLFINNLPLVLKNNIGVYADDSTLYASAPTLADVEEKIRPDIDAVLKWRKENKIN